MGTINTYYCLAALKKTVSFIKLLYIAEFYHFSRFSAPIACNKELRNLRRLSASGIPNYDQDLVVLQEIQNLEKEKKVMFHFKRFGNVWSNWSYRKIRLQEIQNLEQEKKVMFHFKQLSLHTVLATYGHTGRYACHFGFY